MLLKFLKIDLFSIAYKLAIYCERCVRFPLSGVGVKEERRSIATSSPWRWRSDPRSGLGVGFKPHPSSHMAANGFPEGEREGEIK